MAEKAEKKTTVKKAAPKKAMPKIYTDAKNPKIQMHSSMIRTVEDFKKIWQGNVRATDLDAAWDRAKDWRDSYK